ncbi:MAG: hypothetical protein ACM3XZ_00605 [Betaproteobacteria bacterium]
MGEPAAGFAFLFRARLYGPLWREAHLAVVVGPSRDLDEARVRAEAACRAFLARVLPGWQREVAERRAAAEEELARYYHRSLTEEVARLGRVLHQVAVLRVRVSLARRTTTRRQFRADLRRWEKELTRQVEGTEGRAGQLAAELRRRQAELVRRYASRVEVRLVAAAPLGEEKGDH